MKNSCSKQANALALMAALAGLILALWPATGHSQRSSRRQSPGPAQSVDPNAGGPRNSWASFDVILNRNIFSRQRTSARRTEEIRESRSVVAPNPESYYLLKGVVQENDDFIAFIEDTQSGTVLRLRRGDPVARGTIKTLTLDGLEYQMEEKTVVVRMGLNLEGGQGVPATGQILNLAPAPASSTSGQPAPSSPKPSAPSGAEADILKRLMEQRKQQLGQ